ncbi:MAG: hypothetical protein K2N04_03115 [Alistipes sp.]|nr:hypothetical protein [Alistipes sp.]
MKKILLLMAAIFAVGFSYAQDVTYYTTRIAQIYHGKPKTVMDIAEGLGICIMEFDKNGRIISKKQDEYECTNFYEWGENTIKVSTVKPDGSVVNIIELNYVEDVGHLLIDNRRENIIDHVFNMNGTMSKFIHTYKDMPSFTAQFEYANDNPSFFVKIKAYRGKKLVGEFDTRVIEFDEQGNCTEFVETGNGQEMTTHRRIIYYDEE